MCSASRVAPPSGASLLHALCLLGSSTLLTLPTTAFADITVLDKDGVTVEVGATAGVGVFHVGNANLGAGVAKTDGGVDKNRDWVEGFVAPSAKITLSSDRVGAFYSGVRVVGGGTAGTGDAGGVVQGRQGRFDVDHLYAGWRSGALFSSLGDDAFDITVGRQPFNIGDGFIINDGNADGRRDGAYWLAPRTGWGPSSVVARVDVKPFHADVFRLKSDKDSSSDVIYGANLEWRSGPDGKTVVGGTALRVAESKLVARDDLKVYSLRAQGAFLPSLPDLFLSTEYVKERNSRPGAEMDAQAWYGEAAYTLSQLPWTPKLGYRYSHFSGDNPATSKSEAFDTLHYGGGVRGWGTWFQGEIAGQYFFPIMNSNVNVNTVQLSAQPLETVTVSALYYVFNFDRKPVGVTSGHVGNEVNLIVDWQATENLSLSGIAGRFDPGAGGKQLLGGDRSTSVFEVIATAKF